MPRNRSQYEILEINSSDEEDESGLQMKGNRLSDDAQNVPPMKSTEPALQDQLKFALQLKRKVTKRQHKIMSDLRDEICKHQGRNLHDISERQYHDSEPREKKIIKKKLIDGIIIRQKILEEDIRKTLWPGLEDPRHIEMIDTYDRKLSQFRIHESLETLRKKRIKHIDTKIKRKNRGHKRSSHGVSASHTSLSLEQNYRVPDGCSEIINNMNGSLQSLMREHQKYDDKVNHSNECSLSNKTIRDFNALHTYLNNFHSKFNHQAQMFMQEAA